jgi:CDP-diacylglycerol--glycerol-3-phosphate 3-phosphatidyltransferase
MKIREIINKDIFTIANFITSLRVIFIIPLYLIFEWEKNLKITAPDDHTATYWLIIVLILIVMTDFFDGKIARGFNQKSKFGKYFDPFCDKIVIITGLLMLVIYKNFPVWIVVFLYLREFLAVYVGLFLFYKRDFQAESNFWGKIGVAVLAFSTLWYMMIPLLPQEGLYLHPEISLIPLILVQIIGIVSYGRKYWHIFFQLGKK